MYSRILHSINTQACIECKGDSNNCKVVTPDGPGVSDADMIMYVAAFPDSPCGPESTTIAYAGACLLEDDLDRFVSVNLVISCICNHKRINGMLM